MGKQCFGNLKQNSWFEKWWKGFHDFSHTLFVLFCFFLNSPEKQISGTNTKLS